MTEATEGTLRAIQTSLESEKIRWMAGKAPELLEKENVYGERSDPERVREVLEATVQGRAAQEPHPSLPGSRTDDGKGDQCEARYPAEGDAPHLVSLVGEGRIGFDPSEEGHHPRYVRSG